MTTTAKTAAPGKTAAKKAAAPVESVETPELTAEELAEQAAAEKAGRQALTPLHVLEEDRDDETVYFDLAGTNEVGNAVTIALPKTVRAIKYSAAYMSLISMTGNGPVAIYGVLDKFLPQEALKLEYVEDDFDTAMRPLVAWANVNLLAGRSPKSV